MNTTKEKRMERNTQAILRRPKIKENKGIYKS